MKKSETRLVCELTVLKSKFVHPFLWWRSCHVRIFLYLLLSSPTQTISNFTECFDGIPFSSKKIVGWDGHDCWRGREKEWKNGRMKEFPSFPFE